MNNNFRSPLTGVDDKVRCKKSPCQQNVLLPFIQLQMATPDHKQEIKIVAWYQVPLNKEYTISHNSLQVQKYLKNIMGV